MSKRAYQVSKLLFLFGYEKRRLKLSYVLGGLRYCFTYNLSSRIYRNITFKSISVLNFINRNFVLKTVSQEPYNQIFYPPVPFKQVKKFTMKNVRRDAVPPLKFQSNQLDATSSNYFNKASL
jgi:hypothetical protein